MPSNLSDEPGVKLVPKTNTVVPPSAGPNEGVIAEIVGGCRHGLLTCSVTGPLAAGGNALTRICSTVPAAIDSGVGPGDGLGMRLVKFPPLLSSLALNVRAFRVEPVKTASTVSNGVPTVSMNEVGL